MAHGVKRNPVIQHISSDQITVGTTAVPLSDNSQPEAYIDSILINVPSAEAQGVFFGDQSVTINTGVEIQAGVIFNLALANQRQLYELQFPLVEIAKILQCERLDMMEIPYVVWDPAQLWLVAAANTDVRLLFFRSVYV